VLAAIEASAWLGLFPFWELFRSVAQRIKSR
jgi:hypothetical protein